MNVRLKRARELAGYAVQLTKDEGLPTMLKRGAGFVRRRCFGKRARYLPAKKVLEAQRAEMAGKTAADCGLPTISILTPLYNTPEKYLREFLDSFVNQTAPNGQLCLADASDAEHADVKRIVEEYQTKNQRIVYKKIENKGIAANTNAAAEHGLLFVQVYLHALASQPEGGFTARKTSAQNGYSIIAHITGFLITNPLSHCLAAMPALPRGRAFDRKGNFIVSTQSSPFGGAGATAPERVI